MLDKTERDEGLYHFERGVAFERVNRILEAVEEYQLAIARYPHLREAHAALGFYYQRNGLLAKAADEFRSVANLDSDFLAHFNLGHILVELGRYEEALDSFIRCLDFDPGDPATHYEIALIHFFRGQFDLALDYLFLPLRSYPDDWEVLSLIAKSHLGLKHYDEAKGWFEQSIEAARRSRVKVDLSHYLHIIKRCREFSHLTTIKDRLYAYEGAICLGSAQDDGITISEGVDYHLTYPDIAVTIRRFLAIRRALGWQFTAVVSADKSAVPLAESMGCLLDLPVRHANELTTDDRALLVMSVTRDPSLISLAKEYLPCRSVSLCLGFNQSGHQIEGVPEVVGVMVRGACSVPWEPELRRLYADGASRECLGECTSAAVEQLIDAVRHTSIDMNITSQIAYYMDHPLLRLNHPRPAMPAKKPWDRSASYTLSDSLQLAQMRSLWYA